MRLNVKALTAAGAILWGGAALLVGIGNLMFPPYGDAFLDLLASLYPGYSGLGTGASVLVVTVYAVMDGAVCGFLVAWLYNALIRIPAAPRADTPGAVS